MLDIPPRALDDIRTSQPEVRTDVQWRDARLRVLAEWSSGQRAVALCGLPSDLAAVFLRELEATLREAGQPVRHLASGMPSRLPDGPAIVLVDDTAGLSDHVLRELLRSERLLCALLGPHDLTARLSKLAPDVAIAHIEPDAGIGPAPPLPGPVARPLGWRMWAAPVILLGGVLITGTVFFAAGQRGSSKPGIASGAPPPAPFIPAPTPVMPPAQTPPAPAPITAETLSPAGPAVPAASPPAAATSTPAPPTAPPEMSTADASGGGSPPAGPPNETASPPLATAPASPPATAVPATIESATAAADTPRVAAPAALPTPAPQLAAPLPAVMTPDETSPAPPMPLPAAATPDITVRYAAGDPKAAVLARNLAAYFRATGFEADEPVASATRKDRAAVRYFFLEDRAEAEDVALRIGQIIEDVPVELGRGTASARPGQIEVVINLHRGTASDEPALSATMRAVRH